MRLRALSAMGREGGVGTKDSLVLADPQAGRKQGPHSGLPRSWGSLAALSPFPAF